jgi:ABC transporter DrrB family efflux protein
MTVLEPPAGMSGRIRWALEDGATVTKRNLLQIRRVPEKLLDVTIQPIVLVVLFSYVFGSAIVLPGGGDYREYLMPGIFVQSVFFTAGSTAVSVSLDMTEGIVDRFRSLPMARSAMLTGRTVSDLFGTALSLVIMAICGLLVGWRAHHGVADATAGFALLLLVGYAISWTATWVGLWVRTPEAATAFTMAVLIPLTFVANTFVPTLNMPTWMRYIAEWNPISAAVAGCRKLFGNPNPLPSHTRVAWPLAHPILATVLWSALLLAVFVPLAVRRYRTATSR